VSVLLYLPLLRLLLRLALPRPAWPWRVLPLPRHAPRPGLPLRTPIRVITQLPIPGAGRQVGAPDAAVDSAADAAVDGAAGRAPTGGGIRGRTGTSTPGFGVTDILGVARAVGVLGIPSVISIVGCSMLGVPSALSLGVLHVVGLAAV